MNLWGPMVGLALLTWVSGNAQATPTSDIVQSILLTAHKGNHLNADSARFRVGRTYERFLHYALSDDPICSNLESAPARICKAFQEQELGSVANGRWSGNFSFNKAEFSQNLAIYNFYRALPRDREVNCAVVLQLSLDLASTDVVNDEFWLTCFE